jgi:CheY-like chemotaxis protein
MMSCGFDAVFSDVVMPRMSGIELGQEIRRLYPDLPIIGNSYPLSHGAG